MTESSESSDDRTRELLKRGSMTLRPATPADLEALRTLLGQAQLTDDGLETELAKDSFVVVTDGHGLFAGAGVEVHEAYGLLRSVVVAPAHQKKGMGALLVDDRLAWSRERGLKALYLLTETAPDFFARRGFERVERTAAPAAIQRSNEFASLCPKSAIVMKFNLRDSGSV